MVPGDMRVFEYESGGPPDVRKLGVPKCPAVFPALVGAGVL